MLGVLLPGMYVSEPSHQCKFVLEGMVDRISKRWWAANPPA